MKPTTKFLTSLCIAAALAVVVTILLRSDSSQPTNSSATDLPAAPTTPLVESGNPTIDVDAHVARCERGDRFACLQLSQNAISLPAGAADIVQRLAVLCRNGNIEACLHGGIAAKESGNLPVAVDLLGRACDASNAEACELLEKADGSYDPEREDRERIEQAAAEIAASDRAMIDGLRTRCAAGERADCAALANRLASDGIFDDEFVTRLASLEAECERGVVASCVAAGGARAMRNAPEDAPESLRLLETGCSLGDTVACDQVAKATGTLAPAPTPEERTAIIVAEAEARQRDAYVAVAAECDADGGAACLTQASMLAHGNGVEPDVTAARAMLEPRCEAEEHTACFALAMLLREDASPESAASLQQVDDLLRGACNGGATEACEQLAKQQL